LYSSAFENAGSSSATGPSKPPPGHQFEDHVAAEGVPHDRVGAVLGGELPGGRGEGLHRRVVERFAATEARQRRGDAADVRQLGDQVVVEGGGAQPAGQQQHGAVGVGRPGLEHVPGQVGHHRSGDPLA
jgi:hypothetical protein